MYEIKCHKCKMKTKHYQGVGVKLLVLKQFISFWAVFVSGSQDLLPWVPGQPDNWQGNEDCVHIRGMNEVEPGLLNDDYCTSSRDFICKKRTFHVTFSSHFSRAALRLYFASQSLSCLSTAKGQGPPPQPPTSGPGSLDTTLIITLEASSWWYVRVYLDMCIYTNWCVLFLFFFAAGWNEKCGSWMADPFNDYCYLFNYLSMRSWADARADCVNQGGDLLSITEPFEQGFVQGVTSSHALHLVLVSSAVVYFLVLASFVLRSLCEFFSIFFLLSFLSLFVLSISTD